METAGEQKPLIPLLMNVAMKFLLTGGFK